MPQAQSPTHHHTIIYISLLQNVFTIETPHFTACIYHHLALCYTTAWSLYPHHHCHLYHLTDLIHYGITCHSCPSIVHSFSHISWYNIPFHLLHLHSLSHNILTVGTPSCFLQPIHSTTLAASQFSSYPCYHLQQPSPITSLYNQS
jgi:hypothetical protein